MTAQLHTDDVYDFVPSTREYYRAIAAAGDTIQQRYQLDDMGQATPAMLDELAALVAVIDRDHGVLKA